MSLKRIGIGCVGAFASFSLFNLMAGEGAIQAAMCAIGGGVFSFILGELIRE